MTTRGTRMLEPHPLRPEPSVIDAVVRVVDAGQRLVLARLDLLRSDLGEFANRSLRSAMFVAVGAFLLAAAWCALMGAATAWLQRYLPLPASLVVVALLTAGMGMAAILVGVTSGQRGRGTPEQDHRQ